jgi:hypothetical protein
MPLRIFGRGIADKRTQKPFQLAHAVETGCLVDTAVKEASHATSESEHTPAIEHTQQEAP